MDLLLLTFLLLVLFQLKHFVADYPLQTEYMLGKFKTQGWKGPLAAHAGVHAGLTLLICMWFTPPLMALTLAIYDFINHAATDRFKAEMNSRLGLRQLTASEYIEAKKLVLLSKMSDNPVAHEAGREASLRLKGNTGFWWSLGLDQMLHHLNHYLIVYIVLVSQASN